MTKHARRKTLADPAAARPRCLARAKQRSLARAAFTVGRSVRAPSRKSLLVHALHSQRAPQIEHPTALDVERRFQRAHAGLGVASSTPAFSRTIDHTHLRRFLDQRVTDGVVRKMIDKWLKAGVSDDPRPESRGFFFG